LLTTSGVAADLLKKLVNLSAERSALFSFGFGFGFGFGSGSAQPRAQRRPARPRAGHATQAVLA
jgi:hypothetical protein